MSIEIPEETLDAITRRVRGDLIRMIPPEVFTKCVRDIHDELLAKPADGSSSWLEQIIRVRVKAEVEKKINDLLHDDPEFQGLFNQKGTLILTAAKEIRKTVLKLNS